MILYAHKSYYIWHSFCRLNLKFRATTFFPGTAKFSRDWSVVENSVWEKKNLNTSSGRRQYIKSGFSLYRHWLVLSVALQCIHAWGWEIEYVRPPFFVTQFALGLLFVIKRILVDHVERQSALMEWCMADYFIDRSRVWTPCVPSFFIIFEGFVRIK